MTDEKKIHILQEALKIAGQYARDNLPTDINFEYINCIIDGASDPSGTKFIEHWLEKAINNENK